MKYLLVTGILLLLLLLCESSQTSCSNNNICCDCHIQQCSTTCYETVVTVNNEKTATVNNEKTPTNTPKPFIKKLLEKPLPTIPPTPKPKPTATPKPKPTLPPPPPPPKRTTPPSKIIKQKQHNVDKLKKAIKSAKTILKKEVSKIKQNTDVIKYEQQNSASKPPIKPTIETNGAQLINGTIREKMNEVAEGTFKSANTSAQLIQTVELHLIKVEKAIEDLRKSYILNQQEIINNSDKIAQTILKRDGVMSNEILQLKAIGQTINSQTKDSINHWAENVKHIRDLKELLHKKEAEKTETLRKQMEQKINDAIKRSQEKIQQAQNKLAKVQE